MLPIRRFPISIKSIIIINFYTLFKLNINKNILPKAPCPTACIQELGSRYSLILSIQPILKKKYNFKKYSAFQKFYFLKLFFYYYLKW